MARPTTISALRAFLGATHGKPEEQITAVLVAGLRANPGLTWRLLERIGVAEMTSVTIDTEVISGAERIDIQFVVTDVAGSHSRAWIEVKLDSPFSQANEQLGRKHQLVRYRDELDRTDRLAGPGRVRSGLAVLVKDLNRSSDRHAVVEVDACVITWQTMSDLVSLYATETFGVDWRREATDPTTTQALGLLDTLRWYLRDHAGVHAESQPLADRDLELYVEAHRVFESVGGLAERACLVLQERRWSAKPFEIRDDPLVVGGERLQAPGPTPWWLKPGPRLGELSFQIAPYDERQKPAGATPTLWIGIQLDRSGGLSASEVTALRDGGFMLEDNVEGTGQTKWIGRFCGLADVLRGRADAGAQATAVANEVIAFAEALAAIKI